MNKKGCGRLLSFVVDLSKFRVTPSCDVGERPYLEIEPTVLWMLPDLSVDNEVLSNTHWHVD